VTALEAAKTSVCDSIETLPQDEMEKLVESFRSAVLNRENTRRDVQRGSLRKVTTRRIIELARAMCRDESNTELEDLSTDSEKTTFLRRAYINNSCDDVRWFGSKVNLMSPADFPCNGYACWYADKQRRIPPVMTFYFLVLGEDFCVCDTCVEYQFHGDIFDEYVDEEALLAAVNVSGASK